MVFELWHLFFDIVFISAYVVVVFSFNCNIGTFYLDHTLFYCFRSFELDVCPSMLLMYSQIHIEFSVFFFSLSFSFVFLPQISGNRKDRV